MRRSFRLKIGLLSLALSSLLLSGFGFIAVSALNRVGIERIDRELLALTDAQVRRPQPPGHWPVFADSLRSVYGQDATRTFVVQVDSPALGRLYASPDWPADFSSEALPLALTNAREDTLQPTPDDFRPRPPPPADDSADRPHGPPDRPDRPDRLARPDRPDRSPPPRPLTVRGPVYATLGGSAAGWRAITIANKEVTVSLAMRLDGLRAETRRFLRTLLVSLPAGLFLIVAGGWFLGHMALRPVNIIARTAESVTAHRLNERIPDANADTEFRRLILVINGMLERLERSFRQATRFSADAAHELKTPLAILQAQLERSLQRAVDGSPEQREYAEQLDEVQRLKVILGKLLLLSRADAGQLPLSLEPVNLADTLRASAEDVPMLAPDRKVTVTAPPTLTISADPHLLNQVIENLVSNAIKFGEQNGTVTLTLIAHDNRAIFRISNTGRPVPEADQARIFDRFYRGDKSRSREVEGSGLGLSLAREIARAHGGDLELESSSERETTFRLTLPLATPHA